MNTIKQYKEVSIEEFIEAIEKLPRHDIRGGWIWWLRDYNKPGPYDRLTDQNHTAKFAYNHMTHPAMLIWLIEEAGVEKHLAKKAKVESGNVEKFVSKFPGKYWSMRSGDLHDGKGQCAAGVTVLYGGGVVRVVTECFR
jgi:hypothetical protein